MTCWPSALACLLLAGAGQVPPRPLVPQEVVVVVNANAEGSEALGKFYCLARNILEDRVIVLRTDPAATVSRQEFDKNIRGPIREFLARDALAGKIRCLALMWGVPVRVLGSEPSAEDRKLLETYNALSERLHVRLAVNARLVETVGQKFPPPRSADLRSVGEFFEPDVAADLGKKRKFEEYRDAVLRALNEKEPAAAKIGDAARRQVALRQLAALRLDCFGPANLLKHLPPEAVAGVPDAAGLQKELDALQAEQTRLARSAATPDDARELVEVVRNLRGVSGAYEHCHERIKAIDTAEEDAAVDSELALLWEEGASLRGPRPNPMNWRLGLTRTRPADLPGRILMTARVDGPTARDALRIVKDSVAVEKTGLEGKFYIDAGGKYPVYDQNFRLLADLLKKHTRLPVVLNDKKDLFAPGSCPDAALYVGWYSLQDYVPAFTWSRGAVGWHVASLEAMHLRTPTSKEWCVKMIQGGVTATVGAVNEPFLGHFPLPQDFFCLLLTGRFTVAECYWRTVPAASWRLTLIADPLYNPFRLKPHASIYALPPALVGRAEGQAEP